MTDNQIFQMVNAAYEDAFENGYDFADFTLEEIATDMLTYGAFVDEPVQPTLEEVVDALRRMKIKGNNPYPVEVVMTYKQAIKNLLVGEEPLLDWQEMSISENYKDPKYWPMGDLASSASLVISESFKIDEGIVRQEILNQIQILKAK